MSEANGRVESTASGQKRDNKLLDEDEEEEEVVGVVPPDGGWGWMVVLSSFLIHIIADGIVYSFGIFFVEFVDYFNSSKCLRRTVVSSFKFVREKHREWRVIVFVYTIFCIPSDGVDRDTGGESGHLL